MGEGRVMLEAGGARWDVQVDRARSIAVPLDFGGPQPSAFGLGPAVDEVVVAGSFVGDTRRGGGANCRTVRLNPHGNGTHTECVGHIVDEDVYVGEVAPLGLVPATLLTVNVVEAGESAEGYRPAPEAGDRWVSRAGLEAAFEAAGGWASGARALVIRTLPNTPEKMAKEHSGANSPYLSEDAMSWIVGLGVEHLLVDLPSVDREEDGGLLVNHHLFWGVEPGEHTLGGRAPSQRTITEMIYVPPELVDGVYGLNLQVPHFLQDAAPSRPVLLPLRRRS